ncbi:MAG: hypothetical protein HKN12_11145 [Gemmatimonadetes bacterium]|nr:hypothetical protein [Gemmatimonadota bacterium]
MSPRRALQAALLAGSAVLLFWTVSSASPSDDIRLARDYYLISDYETALARLGGVISLPDLDPETRVAALVLKARCDVGIGGRQAGVDSFCSVLRLSPSWRPPDHEVYPQAEVAAYQRALDLCGPLTVAYPPVRYIRRGTPVNVVYPENPDLGLDGMDTSRSWYRNPYVLGAAGGVAASLLFLLLEPAADSPPPALPDFPEPPQ